MNAITERFLKYRSSPKPQAEPPPAPKKYEIEGFISKEETVLERMGRLVEAIAAGLELSEDNMRFFKKHRRYGNGPVAIFVGVRSNQDALKAEKHWEAIRRATKLPYQGGAFSP